MEVSRRDRNPDTPFSGIYSDIRFRFENDQISFNYEGHTIKEIIEVTQRWVRDLIISKLTQEEKDKLMIDLLGDSIC